MSFGPLLIFIAAVLWGLDGILRRSLYSLPPITIVFFEHLIGLIIIAPFLWRAWAKETLTKREWGAIALVSLFSGVLGTLFFTTALLKVNFISFSVVYLIQKLQPVFAILMGALILRERPSREFVAWATLALVAGYFVTFPYGIVNFAEGGAHLIAAGLALLAAICWGSSTAFSRYTLLNHSNTFMIGIRFLITIPIALLLAWTLGATESFGSVTGAQYGTLALIALSTGMLALWIYYRGLATTPVRVAAMMELAYPTTAVLVDFFLYGTILAWSQYLAAAVLLFAMYKAAKKNS
ncbi:MAG: DMT family transporter [Minisyncoccia bacterium]